MIIFLQGGRHVILFYVKSSFVFGRNFAATGVLVLICALILAGFAWERHQLKANHGKLAVLIRLLKERDKSIMDLNQTIETMNKAEQHFHSQGSEK